MIRTATVAALLVGCASTACLPLSCSLLAGAALLALL
jgi:hypothetical protein